MKKDLTPAQLKLFREGDERLFDAITREAVKDIERVVNRFYRKINARLGQLRVTDSDRANTAEKLRLIRDIRVALESALGPNRNEVPEVVREYIRLAKRAEKRALLYFEKFGTTATLGRTSQKTIEILLTEQTDGLLRLFDERLRRPIIRQIRAETLGLGNRETFVESVSEAGSSLSTAQIEVAVADGFRQVHRITNKLAADDNELLAVAVWRGPRDKKTSDQCRRLFDEAPYGAPGVWLKSDVNAGMVTGLAGDPAIEGGHPNCRHHFNYVDRKYAEKYLGAKF